MTYFLHFFLTIPGILEGQFWFPVLPLSSCSRAAIVLLLVRVYRADGRCWCENGWCVSLPAASSICHSSEERPHLPSVCFHLSQFPRSSSSFKRSQSILQQIVQNSQKWWLALSPKIIGFNLSRDNLFCNSNFFWHLITFDHITSEAWHWENGQLYTTSSTRSLILW